MASAKSPHAVVSAAQMRGMDEAAITRYHIPRLLLMEHAGEAVARIVKHLLNAPGGRSARTRVAVCCGSGYNGGDGLCAAWHLAHDGYATRAMLAGRIEDLPDEPAVYARILRALKIPCLELEQRSDLAEMMDDLKGSHMVVDALLGIGLRGPVRPLHARLIDAINRSGRPVVAVDIPSGLDADSGLPLGCAVEADVTVTFGAVKQGLVRPSAGRYVGRLLVEDIGIPRAVLPRARSSRIRRGRS